MIKFVSILILFSSIYSFAQKRFELKDLFTEKKMTWYGIDYTQTRFTGTFTGKDLNEYFHGWNKLVTQEPDKYDLAKFLQKQSIIKDMNYVERINQESTPHVGTVGSDSAFLKADLDEMVLKYESSVQEGWGLVFIAENYNKPKDFATHYAVIFDIATKKILISQKYTTSPDGTGLRNYWASSILAAMKLLRNNYKKWEKKYSS